MDYQVEQEMELEALESILMEDFEGTRPLQSQTHTCAETQHAHNDCTSHDVNFGSPALNGCMIT